MTAANDNIADDTPVRLAEAAARFFPGGGMTARGLRREMQRGRLAAWRIANKDYTTRAAIRDMMEQCRVEPIPQSSNFALPRKTVRLSGSSTTSDANAALAAARATVRALRKR